MTSLLFGTALAALISLASLLTVLFRVSPITAPRQALPAFFFSLFLTVTTIGTLIFYFLWRSLPEKKIDEGKLLSMSLREGAFLGLGTVFLVLFHILELLNWWIGILIYLVFLFVELALEH